jgi:hypothetical protein
MANTVPNSDEAGAMSAVSSMKVGNQGDGEQPSLVSEAEDAISQLQVADSESSRSAAGGEGDGDLSEQVSSQTLEPTEDAEASSAVDSCKGSDEGDSAPNSESEDSVARSSDHQKRDGRTRKRSGDARNRRRRAPSRKREPSLTEVQRFFADPYTQTVLYPGKYFGEKPADCIKFCADAETGLPQHT